jgi:hypothetical protein
LIRIIEQFDALIAAVIASVAALLAAVGIG